jgi:2-oxoglutarate/2-oxoacid ferredoxin oxidoreductase subunit alpha
VTAKRLMEGSHALAESAIQAGCRFYAGYPITPSTEILEYMSARLPEVGGVCVNAESEIEAIHMVWGAAATGARAMIASTGQGISLMQEAFAELANAQIPIVAVNMMRGQGDYFQATRGGGHGDYRFVVLAPATVQEAADLARLAFDVAERWRNPVMILGDFLLAHTTEAVELHRGDGGDTTKAWAVGNARGRQAITLSPLGGPKKLGMSFGTHLAAATDKHPAIRDEEVRVETGGLEDADLVVVAYGSPARFVKHAALRARSEGLRVGWLRPISLWPFPTKAVAEAASGAKRMAVFELSAGQMIEDVELAVAGGVAVAAIGGVSHDSSGFGVGPLLRSGEILERIKRVYPS